MRTRKVLGYAWRSGDSRLEAGCWSDWRPTIPGGLCGFWQSCVWGEVSFPVGGTWIWNACGVPVVLEVSSSSASIAPFEESKGGSMATDRVCRGLRVGGACCWRPSWGCQGWCILSAAVPWVLALARGQRHHCMAELAPSSSWTDTCHDVVLANLALCCGDEVASLGNSRIRKASAKLILFFLRDMEIGVCSH